MTKLKVGDKIKVIGNLPSFLSDFSGKEGVVKLINKTTGLGLVSYNCFFDDPPSLGYNNMTFFEGEIELVSGLSQGVPKSEGVKAIICVCPSRDLMNFGCKCGAFKKAG